MRSPRAKQTSGGATTMSSGTALAGRVMAPAAQSGEPNYRELMLTAAPLIPTPRPPEGAPSFDEMREHVASRLARAPRYRQKLAEVPFGVNDPVWIDDEDFDVSRHVRHADGRDFGFARLIRAQATGDYESLKERGRRVARVRLEEVA